MGGNPKKVKEWNTSVLPDGRWMLFHAETRTVHTLTAPAGILWELCDGETAVDEIIKQLQEYYPDAEYAVLQEQTNQLLEQLLEQELIVHAGE